MFMFVIDKLHEQCSRNTTPGQELCYFCHQRNKRNVYVDISEEKKAKELQYEKILHEYQDKKHHLTVANDVKAKKMSQLYAEDAATYNFELAQKKVSGYLMTFI